MAHSVQEVLLVANSVQEVGSSGTVTASRCVLCR